MQNHFVFSSHVLLLFKEWKIDSTSVLIGGFVGLFFFTLLYEVASFYHSRYAINGGACGLTRGHETETECHENQESHNYGTFNSEDPTVTPSRQNAISLAVRVQIVLTSRYILSSLCLPFLLAANYFIMLAVMTYNAWFLIAVCLASGVAYFLFQSNIDVPKVKHHYNGPGTPLTSSGERLFVHT